MTNKNYTPLEAKSKISIQQLEKLRGIFMTSTKEQKITLLVRWLRWAVHRNNWNEIDDIIKSYIEQDKFWVTWGSMISFSQTPGYLAIWEDKEFFERLITLSKDQAYEKLDLIKKQYDEYIKELNY